MAITKEQALENARKRLQQSDNPYRAGNESASGGENFLTGLELGAKRRALGLLQLGMEATGFDDTDTYKDTQELAKRYRQQGEGTGVSGFAGEVIGDPLTYAPVAGPAAKAGNVGIKTLAKVGTVYGAGAMGTDALEEGQNRLAKTYMGGATGLATAPIAAGVAKITDKAINNPTIRGVLADESGKVGRNVTKGTAKLSKAEATVYRTLVDDLGLDHEAAIKAVREAGAGDIPLSLPEQLDSTRLLGMEKRLRQSAGKAGDIERAFTDMRAGRIASEIPGQLEAVGSVQSLDTAGRATRDAAQKVFSVLKKKRGDLARPLYESGYNKAAPPAAIKEVMDDPLTASVYRSMQKDPRVASRLKEYPKDSIGWISEARKELGGLLGKAQRSGDATAARDYKLASDRLQSIIDRHGGSEIAQANAAFAKASQPINKAEQSLLGVLAEMENGNVAKASQKLFAQGTTPAQIRYARRMIRTVDPAAWDNMVASHIGYIGESVNHSPVKFLNAIGNRLKTGSAYNADKFQAALSTEQRKAIDVLSSSLERASKIRMGSDTQMNAEAAAMLNRELSDGTEEAIGRLAKGTSMKDMAVEAFDWVRGKVMEKRYEELARIFTGQGSEEFAEKLSKMDPKSAAAYQAIIERIAEIEQRAAIAGTRAPAAATQAEPAPKPGQKPKQPVVEPVDKQEIIRRARERLKKGKQNEPDFSSGASLEGSIPNLSGSVNNIRPNPDKVNLPGDIRQDEGERLTSYMDTTGNRTVGIGFNMDSGVARKAWKKAGIQTSFNDVYAGEAGISPQEAQRLAEVSYQVAMEDAREFLPVFDRLTSGRKQALANLSYQLGSNRLAKFTGFQTAMNKGDYVTAARELVNSKWFDQTQDDRKRRVIQQILKG